MRVRIALVFGVLSLMNVLSAQTQTSIKKVPLKSTPAYSGKEMFANYCASCHGPDGSGNGPAAPALKPAPTNLTQLAVQNSGKFPEDRVNTILSGMAGITAHGSSEMPVWGELFKGLGRGDHETIRLRIANLIDYVKTIQAN